MYFDVLMAFVFLRNLFSVSVMLLMIIEYRNVITLRTIMTGLNFTGFEMISFFQTPPQPWPQPSWPCWWPSTTLRDWRCTATTWWIIISSQTLYLLWPSVLSMISLVRYITTCNKETILVTMPINNFDFPFIRPSVIYVVEVTRFYLLLCVNKS